MIPDPQSSIPDPGSLILNPGSGFPGYQGFEKWAAHPHPIWVSDSKLCKFISLSVSVLDNQLNSVRTSFKYLEVVLSSKFTWTKDMEHVMSKVKQRFGKMRLDNFNYL